MALELKPGADTAGLPTVTLAGKDYFVAPLLLRQTIANIPLMPKALAVAEKFVRLARAMQPGDGEAPPPAAPEFTAADFDPLVDVVVNGLLRLYPAATRDDLLDSDLKLAELLNALPVVVTQSGGKKTDADLGEQKAASAS